MINKARTSTKKAKKSLPLNEKETNNQENVISDEKIREFETIFKIMSYWEIDVSFLEYEQRGTTRKNDNFIILAFQLKFNNNKIGAPVKLFEYCPINIKDKHKNKKNLDKFIEKVIKEKIDFMNLSSGIELKYLSTFKDTLQHYKISIENENIQIESTDIKNEDSLNTIEKTLSNLVSSSVEIAIPIVLTAFLALLGGKRK